MFENIYRGVRELHPQMKIVIINKLIYITIAFRRGLEVGLEGIEIDRIELSCNGCIASVELLIGDLSLTPCRKEWIPQFADRIFCRGAEFVHCWLLLRTFLNPTDMEVILTVRHFLGEEVGHLNLHIGVRKSTVLTIRSTFGLSRQDVAIGHYNRETDTAAGIPQQGPYVLTFCIERTGGDATWDKVLIDTYT